MVSRAHECRNILHVSSDGYPQLVHNSLSTSACSKLCSPLHIVPCPVVVGAAR